MWSQSLVSHPAENTFAKFGFLVIYHTSFFIFVTTIGLNIIFGIIVDTFSELRNLKVGQGQLDQCHYFLYSLNGLLSSAHIPHVDFGAAFSVSHFQSPPMKYLERVD